jgi:hypothetical protein
MRFLLLRSKVIYCKDRNNSQGEEEDGAASGGTLSGSVAAAEEHLPDYQFNDEEELRFRMVEAGINI